MKLHEGAFIKRALIRHTETASAAAWRVLLRLTEWLGTLSAKYLNRVVLYLQIWPDYTSDVEILDQVMVECLSYGSNYIRQIQSLGLMGSTSVLPEEVEFNLAYPGGVNPSVPTDTLLKLRTMSWAALESHIYLIEVNAYLQDVEVAVLDLTD